MFKSSKKIKYDTNQVNRHKLSRRIWRDPYLDWLIVFFLCLIISLCLAYVGYDSHLHTKHQIEDSVASSGSKQVSIDTRTLEDMLSRFDARQTERLDISKGAYPFPSDPGL